MSDDILISARDLTVGYPMGNGLFKRSVLKAVNGVSVEIRRGSFFGLVGESGSGKTTFGRALLKAAPITAGHARYTDHEVDYDLAEIGDAELKDYRKRAQLIFQDPYAALSPRMTVRDIIAEPLVATGMMTDRDEIDERVREVAARCKLNLEHLRRFPHAFSGGQRQRICIARALVSRPDFVVCDESVSALDVSIQAEIVNLLKDLQEEMGVSFLFIAHDLSVVAQISHRVAVLYVGKFVEYAPTEKLFFEPRHPYTHALLSAIPQADPDADFDPIRLQGEIPNPLAAPSGCRFHTRCPFAREQCSAEEPAWREIADDHFVACHFAEEFDFSRAGA